MLRILVLLASVTFCFGWSLTSGYKNENNKIVCGVYQEACENTLCYTPGKGEVCLRNGTTIRVCSYQQELCGSSCYSPVAGQVCLWPTPTTAVICSSGSNLCFGNNTHACYDIGSKSCIQHGGNGYICNYGDQVCGRWCHNPGHIECHNDDVRCLVGDELCGRSCYSAVNGGLCLQGPNGATPCNNGNTALCGTQCYSPGRWQSCFVNGTTSLVCQVGQEICPLDGRACYNPRLGQNCFRSPSGNVRICGFNQQLCGESACFNPSVGEQCFE